MARKVASLLEVYGVKTAWHGPTNVSPIGHCINLHVDLSSFAFGIGEGGNFSDQLKERIPACRKSETPSATPTRILASVSTSMKQWRRRYAPRDPGENRVRAASTAIRSGHKWDLTPGGRERDRDGCPLADDTWIASVAP
jgi:hypothetical protein